MASTRENKTISQFKSQLIGGGARPNLFEVELTTLPAGIAWPADNFRYMCKAAQLPASVIANIDVNNYLKNNHLLKIVKNKEIKPHEIAYMKSEDIFPEKWKNIQTDLKRKEDGSKVNKNVSITDQFRCGKCKKRECSYYELQIRSADESATLFITCLNCNTKWRQ